MNSIIVTGGAGFIGSCFVRKLVETARAKIVVIDKLTYAGHLESLPAAETSGLQFIQGDIGDIPLLRKLLSEVKPSAIINFAAESHVDRSIDGPAAFVETNVVGTFHLLTAARDYFASLSDDRRAGFRFVHISTDEVYGSLGASGKFTETTPYAPNSPYSASKASSDMFVRAFNHTFGLPTLITNCSNNYGPYQYPEKLVPLMILNAVEGKSLPVYGNGVNVRDWLFVEDHCAAIEAVLTHGRPGETYNVGGDSERSNIEVVREICSLVDELTGGLPHGPTQNLISFVQDRPGHDLRYAIDASKIKRELGWLPSLTFEAGLRRTVEWYLNNPEWIAAVTDGKYDRQRLGLADVAK